MRNLDAASAAASAPVTAPAPAIDASVCLYVSVPFFFLLLLLLFLLLFFLLSVFLQVTLAEVTGGGNGMRVTEFSSPDSVACVPVLESSRLLPSSYEHSMGAV